MPSSGLWEENAVLNSSERHTKGNSAGDGEFDRCIPLSAYTTEKFIPALMPHMSIDPAESRTIMMQKSHYCTHSTDINTFTTLFFGKKKKALHRVFKPLAFSPAQFNGAHRLM